MSFDELGECMTPDRERIDNASKATIVVKVAASSAVEQDAVELLDHTVVLVNTLACDECVQGGPTEDQRAGVIVRFRLRCDHW